MIKYTFDLDQDLYDYLVKESEKNDRSMAAQLRTILKDVKSVSEARKK